MKALTPAQAKVLEFCRDFLRENQQPPTRTEISAHFEWASANAAQAHLKAIERKGFIRIASDKSRGIFII